MEVAGSEQSGAVVAKPSRGVRQGDVDKAADSILAKGQRPTVERIRQVLGTGSPNTLGPLIDNWYRTLSARVAGMQHAAGAEGRAPTAAINAFNLLWDTALNEARTTVEGELAGQREQLAGERAALREDQRVLEATREALEEAGHATRERIRELEAQVIAGQQQLQRAQQTAAAVGERSAQIQQELSQAHRELKDQAAAHEEQRQREVERSAANERRLLADVDRARGEARAAQDETKRAHAQRAEQEQAAAAALKQSRQQVADLSQALAAREEELARAQTVIERAGGLEQSLRELAATAQARAQDLHAALESERTTTIELRTRLETQLKGDQGKPQSPVPGSPRRSAVRKKR